MIAAVEGGIRLLKPDRRGSWSEEPVEWPGGSPTALLPSGRRVIAAAEGGAWSSLDGRKWQPAPEAEGRDIGCLAGGGSAVYACERSGALLASEDSGATWAEKLGLKDALASGQAGVTALGLDPAKPATVWAAVEGGDVMCSRDSGQSWEAAGKVPAEVRLLEGSHYGGPWSEALTREALFAATPAGFYKSRDAGAKWELSSGGMTVLGCTAMTVRRKHGQTIFLAAFDEKSGAAIFRSVDYGYRWERVREGLPEPGSEYSALCFDQADPYVVFAGTTDGRVFSCSEAGGLWHPLHAGLPAIRAIAAL